MGQRTRNQEYKYQYKNLSVSNYQMCGYGPSLQVSIPNDLIAIKSLWMHVVAFFDPAVEPTGNRQFNSLALNSIAGGSFFFSSQYQQLPLGKVADGSGYVDFQLDLTHLIPKLYFYPTDTDSSPYFIMGLEPPSLLTGGTSKIMLWKLDLIYTTEGIR